MKRTIKRIVGGLLALVVLGLGLLFTLGYENFAHSLIEEEGVSLNHTRGEVIYRLGYPPEVLAPEKVDFKEGAVEALRVFYVSGPPGDQNTLPSDKKVNDFSFWGFSTAQKDVRLTVTFEGDKVKSVSVFTDRKDRWAWGPVAGVHNGDSEGVVLALGQPSSSKIDGVSKTIRYDDLGVEFTLTRGSVYMVEIKSPVNGGALNRLSHYTRALGAHGF